MVLPALSINPEVNADPSESPLYIDPAGLTAEEFAKASISLHCAAESYFADRLRYVVPSVEMEIVELEKRALLSQDPASIRVFRYCAQVLREFEREFPLPPRSRTVIVVEKAEASHA